MSAQDTKTLPSQPDLEASVWSVSAAEGVEWSAEQRAYESRGTRPDAEEGARRGLEPYHEEVKLLVAGRPSRGRDGERRGARGDLRVNAGELVRGRGDAEAGDVRLQGAPDRTAGAT